MEHFILCVFRNTSEARKSEIISDLQLPLSHPDKLLKAVVATISLGVGVDLRVKNVVSFGLGSTPEDIVQEAGRCLRGCSDETEGQRGLAFFFQKGGIAAMHCPPSSDSRSLISDPLPKCQTTTLFRFFDQDFEHNSSPCVCCYSCITRDSDQGCQDCYKFLNTYLHQKKLFTQSRSTLKEIKCGLQELFRGLRLKFIEVESNLQLTVENFSEDFVRAFDEISGSSDIVKLWHIDKDLAEDVYGVCLEVLEDNNPTEYESNEDSISEVSEEYTDSEDYTDSYENLDPSEGSVSFVD